MAKDATCVFAPREHGDKYVQLQYVNIIYRKIILFSVLRNVTIFNIDTTIDLYFLWITKDYFDYALNCNNNNLRHPLL